MTVMPLPPVSSSQPLLPWGETQARTYAPGMGQAVADRTINRRIVRRLAIPKRVAFEVPRDDSTSLESQLAAWARRNGWAYEGHFFVEHNRGHHVRVATPEDPASSRFGENFYEFLPRSVAGSLRSAWELEKQRLERLNLPVWSVHNHNLQAWAMTVISTLASIISPHSIVVRTGSGSEKNGA